MKMSGNAKSDDDPRAIAEQLDEVAVRDREDRGDLMHRARPPASRFGRPTISR